MISIRITHRLYGPGYFRLLLPEGGQCRALFDIDDGIERRVRARTETDRDERKTMTFYFCVDCCEAMARVQYDDGKALEARCAARP